MPSSGPIWKHQDCGQHARRRCRIAARYRCHLSLRVMGSSPRRAVVRTQGHCLYQKRSLMTRLGTRVSCPRQPRRKPNRRESRVLGLALPVRMHTMAETDRSGLTPRLRLVPIGPSNAADFWLVHNDDAVVPWYNGWRPSRREADDKARHIAESWRLYGVHKWMAYDRETGEVVGRGGLSRAPIDDDWGQISTPSCPTSPGCVRPTTTKARSRCTRTGWRSAGRCAESIGGRAMRRRSARRTRLRVRRARGACRRVIHTATQLPVAGSHGAHRHALRRRDLQPGHG